MDVIESSEDRMEYISNMDSDNSVIQFSIPGKGKFALVLQEEAVQSIKADVVRNPQLGRMIQESQSEYKAGKGMSTEELLKSISAKDFE